MKLAQRGNTKLIHMCGVISASLLFSHLALSAPPDLNQWSVSNGQINAPCPTGAICSDQNEDDGFLQRKVTIGTETYIQHIVTEPGATGGPTSASNPAFSAGSLSFSSEESVGQGAANGLTHGQTNLAERTLLPSNREQRVVQNATMGDYGNGEIFQEVSELDVSDPLNPVEIMKSTAWISGAFPDYSVRATSDGPGMDSAFSQTIDLGNGGIQGFAHQQTPRPDHPYTPDPLNPLLPGGTNGGNIPVSTNGYLYATWVGQYMPGITTPQNSGEFSVTTFRSFDRSTSTPYETKLISTADANPPPWPATFIDYTPQWVLDWIALDPTILNDPILGPVLNGLSHQPIGDYFAQPADIKGPRPSVAPVAWATPTANFVPIPAATPAPPTGTGGPPVPLGGWTVTNGVITPTVPCPSGAVCGTPAISNGLFMRAITVGGVKYLQTIITESNATGDPNVKPVTKSNAFTLPGYIDPSSGRFIPTGNPDTEAFQNNGYLAYADETFVRIGADGIAGRQQFASANGHNPTLYLGTRVPTEIGPVIASTTLNKGWAQGGAGDPSMIIGMDVQDYHRLTGSTYSTSGFLNTLDMSIAGNGAKDYTIAVNQSTTKISAFYSRTIEGGVQNSTRVADPLAPLLVGAGDNGGANDCTTLIPGVSWVPATMNCVGVSGSGSVDIGWSPGDSLRATWIGSNYSHTGGRTRQNTTAFTNLTSGERTEVTKMFDSYASQLADFSPWPDPFTTRSTPNASLNPNIDQFAAPFIAR